MNVDRKLLGSAEVCRRLLINRSTLSRWIKAGRIELAGQLPGENGAMFFDPADVDALEAELSKAVVADTG